MLNIFLLLIELFFVLLLLLTFLFGSIACVVYIYCYFTHKNFKEIYPKALELIVSWIPKANETNNGNNAIYQVREREYTEPIIKALNDSGSPCVEKNVYTFSNVLHYEFQLLDNVKDLDISYLEKLLQSVYYREIVPLYQNHIGNILKENIDIFINRQAQLLYVYIGHSPIAYEKLNEYRQNAKIRELERKNQGCMEMIE